MRIATLSLAVLLCAVEAANGMTVYKDYWMSGTTLYSSASTDDDGVGETASASISIYGPSGSTGVSYWCTYYNAYVSTSLALTSSGDHTVESNHWTTSVSTILALDDVAVTINPEVNYAFDLQSGNSCTYDVSCPGSGGASTKICTNAPSSISVAVPGGTNCAASLPYGFIAYAVAVKFPIVSNRFCYVTTAGPAATNVQHGCTAP